MCNMRTTLTIDDRTDAQLRRIAAKQGFSYKEIVNLALQEGLARLEVTEASPVYKVRTNDYGVRRGVDEDRLNQIEDELAIERVIEQTDGGTPHNEDKA